MRRLYDLLVPSKALQWGHLDGFVPFGLPVKLQAGAYRMAWLSDREYIIVTPEETP